MKKIGSLLALLCVGILPAQASDVDTSIIDELKKGEVQELNVDFSLKTFDSCENLETVMEDYVKSYYTVNKDKYSNNYYRGGGIMVDDMMMLESVQESDASTTSVMAKSESLDSQALPQTGGGPSDDYSETNTQVKGVDESDIIKTDGKYIYYYNNSQKLIYIIEAYGTDEMKVLKKIALPNNFNGPVMYVADNKLVILASGYVRSTNNSRSYYINRNNRTYTIIYDVENKSAPKLEKLYINDGNLSKSRKIGKYLYVVSTNNFNIPYYNFKSVDDINIEIGKILPKKLEISKASNSSDQNLKIKGKSLPYNLKAGNIAKCSEIEYSLPDSETLKNFDFNPSYNIISIINVEDSEAEVKTKVIAGNTAEIYMSLDNLYLTDNMYQTQSFSCPPNARCISPMYWGGTNNTLLHKMNITGNSLSYQDSTIIPGSPLTQYSMDEKDSDFRIITSTNNWGPEREQHTDLYVLDNNLKLVSSVNNLGEGENFQSSRFMGDKLFLVTFKQVDPLFVIDLANREEPAVIGELKIPGYSTYLHPYDENHLIGLGFDTYETEYGATRNGGLKVDLYEVNYDKVGGITSDCEKYTAGNCPSYCNESKVSPVCETKQDESKKDYIEVKQKFTKTFGDGGSYSEATNNPRMFMWNANENTLLLPAALYTKYEDEKYKNKDFFQGLLNIKIDSEEGISEKYRLSHIDYTGLEEERIKECKRYLPSSDTPECKKLIDGSEYCPSVPKQHVPDYCYADSTVGTYLANKEWNYRSSFVRRALWIGSEVYSLSDNKMLKNDIQTGVKRDELEMK